MQTANIVLLMILIFLTKNAQLEITTKKHFLDLQDIDDNVIVWKNLFLKINKILEKTINLEQNVVDLKDNLVKLNYRQNEQEQRLKTFEANTQNHLSVLMKGTNTCDKQLKQYCNNNAWTTVVRRQDGSVNFYRNWDEYKKGFGNLDGEFFIGLERLYAMTASGEPQELMVVIKDFANEIRYAKYDLFEIGSESEKYAIKKLGNYSGNAGDSLVNHVGMKFTTYDQDNDAYAQANCAKSWEGAWWFKACYDSHLFATYRSKKVDDKRGLGWHSYKDSNYPLEFAEMKIRAKVD